MANKIALFLTIITLMLGCCACSFSTDDIDIPTDTVKDIIELPISEDSTTADIESTSADAPDTSDPETEPILPPDDDVPEFEILTDPATPSREDVERLLSHAADIWNQLDIDSLDAIYDQSLKVVDGFYTYFPVREYETKDEFRARLRESFSEMLTEYMLGYLLDWQYKEFDGRLYVSSGVRGTDMRAGAQTMKYEVIDDTTVRVIRCVDVEEIAEMYDGEKYGYIIYLQGVCEQELMLVYEQGRWVFDTFTVFDAIDGYDDGEGIKYDYATDIAYAFLGAEISAAAEDSAVYNYDNLRRRIVGYRENSDATVTVTVQVSARVEGETITLEHDYTAIPTNDGEWKFINFISPERLLTPEYDVIRTVNKNLDILMSGGDFTSETEYIEANPEAFDAIVSLGEAALPYLLDIGESYGEYSYINQFNHMLRCFMAMYAANTIDYRCYDIVSSSPDGTMELRLHVRSFFGLWNFFFGTDYGKVSIVDRQTGQVTVTHEYALRYPEINWSDDGRYAAVIHGDERYIKETYVFDIQSGEMIALPCAEIADMIEIDADPYSCQVTFDEWLPDGKIKLSLLIGFGSPDQRTPIECEFVYDLITKTIIESPV